jgi:lysophospholipase L1-like esterase
MIRSMQFLLLLSSLLLSLGACSKEVPAPQPLRYLALGDSYTIGQGVPADQRYPEQLIAQFREQGIEADSPLVIARTGWTTAELQLGIAQANPEGPFDLVSLLIGVNNQYRGQSIETFQQEFTELLDQAIAFADNRPGRVFVFSIPDYAFTPFGQQRPNPPGISVDLDNFNVLKKQIAQQRGVLFLDITPISRLGLEQPELVAGDQLHPSGEQYRQWLELHLSAIRQLLD